MDSKVGVGQVCRWFISKSVAAQAQRYRFMSYSITRLTVRVGLFVMEQDQGFLGHGRVWLYGRIL